MDIGVIGAGNIGRTLARHLAGLGHQVSIANSRGPATLAELAKEIGATPASVVEAAQAADLVIVSIPEKAVVDLPPGLFTRAASGVVVVDTGNYYPELRDGRIEAIDAGMLDSEWVSQQLGRPVVKAFNSIYAKSLLEKGAPKGTRGRIALPVAGDAPSAKGTVLGLQSHQRLPGRAGGSHDEPAAFGSARLRPRDGSEQLEQLLEIGHGSRLAPIRDCGAAAPNENGSATGGVGTRDVLALVADVEQARARYAQRTRQRQEAGCVRLAVADHR
jgi:predicted dinucleotide-binding enzyme